MFWISSICVGGFVCLYQPFIRIWVKEKNELPFGIVICLSVMFIVQQYRRVLETYKTAAGIWHYDRFRPLIAGIVNLVLNLAMINYIGVFGVVLSTVISEVFVSIPWIIQNVFKYIFEISAKKFILFTSKCTISSLFVMVLLSVVSINLPESGILFIVVRIIVAALVSNLIFILVFFKTEEFKGCLSLAKKMIRR